MTMWKLHSRYTSSHTSLCFPSLDYCFVGLLSRQWKIKCLVQNKQLIWIYAIWHFCCSTFIVPKTCHFFGLHCGPNNAHCSYKLGSTTNIVFVFLLLYQHVLDFSDCHFACELLFLSKENCRRTRKKVNSELSTCLHSWRRPCNGKSLPWSQLTTT